MEEILQEARTWPPEMVGELVERLTADLHRGRADVDAAWRAEVSRRVDDVRAGRVEGIAAEEVSARIRRIVSQ